jgi:hypothetical protein
LELAINQHKLTFTAIHPIICIIICNVTISVT